jgi:hypothetical protein
MFAEYMAKNVQADDSNIYELMLHLGSIIYVSNIKELEQRILRKENATEFNSAKNKAAISILKYRELIQKFTVDKMAFFFDDKIYSKLFEIYAKSVLSGKFQMPEVMNKHAEVYREAFRELINSKRVPKSE